jgi:ABC-type multidrug transport system fused ATPase/permease subunit
MNYLKSTIRLLTPIQRWHGVLLLIAMVFSALLEAASVGLVVPVVTLMMQGDVDQRYPLIHELLGGVTVQSADLVLSGIVLLVVVFLIKALFLGALAYRQASFAFGLQASVSERLFRGYLSQPYMFHLQRNSAQLIRNAINETNQFTFGAILPGMVLITETLVLVGLVALLIGFEPVGALSVMLLGGGVGAAFYLLTKNRSRSWGEDRQVHEGLRIQYLQEGLGGAKEVKLLGRESYFLERYAFHNTASARTGELQTTLQSVPRLMLEFLAVFSLAAVVLMAQASGRSSADLVPVFGLFSVAAFRLIPLANRILVSVQSLRFSLPVLDILTRELDACGAPVNQAEEKKLSFQDRLLIQDMSFIYPKAEQPTLRSIDITILKGQTVGIVGESGAGKSTLVNLILGLLLPSSGQFTVDGQPVQAHLRGWQKNIGYVPQHIYLTDDSLRRNIAFGEKDDDINEAALLRAVQAARLNDFVGSLPEGLSSQVGEGGIRLSGGQRQRVGIARALYSAPQVLVLDEATSALDHETEQGVMEAVSALHGAITILIVAHRLSTVAGCDVVYRLRDGFLEVDSTLGLPSPSSLATAI